MKQDFFFGVRLSFLFVYYIRESKGKMISNVVKEKSDCVGKPEVWRTSV